MCDEFERELKGNHQAEINENIAEGREIGIITRS